MILIGVALVYTAPAAAGETDMIEAIDAVAQEIEPQLVETRRWFHQHPELSNREEKTS